MDLCRDSKVYRHHFMVCGAFDPDIRRLHFTDNLILIRTADVYSVHLLVTLLICALEILSLVTFLLLSVKSEKVEKKQTKCLSASF